MSLRQLVEPDCGGANPLVRLGTHVTRDSAYKDEGLGRGSQGLISRDVLSEDQLVNEFLGQINAPTQTFRMDALLQEMREMDAHNFQANVVKAPLVIDEVNSGAEWIREYSFEKNSDNQAGNMDFNEFWNTRLPPPGHVQQKNVQWVQEFFDVNQNGETTDGLASSINYNEFARFQDSVDGAILDGPVISNNEPLKSDEALSAKWLEEFENNKMDEAARSEEYNQKFWDKLQDEWKKISEDNDAEHPWLSEFTDYYDPYKEYSFSEENPMLKDENALEKGKEFLKQGDIPSAVLCFEAAAKQSPENAEVWELLGKSQAENEMDPNAIAALKKSLELNPNNPSVLMALAVSYTNESLQSQALKVLVTWLHSNPGYKHLVPSNLISFEEGSVTSSIIRGPELKEIQNIFLEAVKQNPNEIDADIQEALGVLFNLSSEYDKAVDCFRAAAQVRPDNAKIWNRLGASLANGNRSVEAVDAYQRALEIEPGFIRARYNVGIICMNLKAYKESVEHLLTALNMQATSFTRSGLAAATESSNQMSNTIWSTLRMVVSLMGRRDLQESLDARDLNALNLAFNSA
ncbi:unnamed protein product [Hermetia illucens]|uniref:Peroxisomal targeting signal 1 receptor n=1 Tax=Hermetia illucens TaxID=343691 RepID=A0A7R8Z0G7_HERIL|nr:peroxisomal targeting signal 1 receptor [Hermetia illucens]CAD7092619.1 unnamed protein product [Hermetia illucens]